MGDGTYENFPPWMVASTLLVQLAVYALGAYILLRIGMVFLVIYVACILALEYRLLRHHCVDCYYYGRSCCFGKGMLCALFFRKGTPGNFSGKEIGWTGILPDFLVALVPILLGIVLLVLRFDSFLLGAVVLLAILAFPGTGLIRSRWSCRFCRQRERGCPAEQLFNRKKGEGAR